MINEEDFIKLPDIYADIERDRKRIDLMRSRLYSPKGLDTRDKVQSSGGANMLAEIVIDLQQKLDARVDVYEALKAEADDLIKSKLDDDTALVMRLRYIEAITWSEIAAILDYSEATLYRYRRQALDKLFSS